MCSSSGETDALSGPVSNVRADASFHAGQQSEEDTRWRRKIAVSVEDLEGRTLLSGIAYSLTTDQSGLPGRTADPDHVHRDEHGRPAGDGLAQPDGFLRLRAQQHGLGVEPGERRSVPDLGDAPTGAVRVPDGDLGWHDHGDVHPARHHHELRGQPVRHVPGLESQRPAGGYGDVPDHQSAPGRLDDRSDDLPVGPTDPAHLHRDEHLRPDAHDLDRESPLPDPA